jgi:hypothetical protein
MIYKIEGRKLRLFDKDKEYPEVTGEISENGSFIKINYPGSLSFQSLSLIRTFI